MNKQQIFDAFDRGIAKSAIVRTDGEPGTWKVVGKFAEIEPVEDGWDVWITDTSAAEATLGTRKVRNILSAAQNYIKPGSLRHYDGEASFRVAEPSYLLGVLPTLGIRKRRRLSPEAREAAAERLSRARLRAA